MIEKTNQIANAHVEALDSLFDHVDRAMATARVELRKFERIGGNGHTLLGDMRRPFLDALARLDKLRSARAERTQGPAHQVEQVPAERIRPFP